jgi:hypothetical protein
MDQGFCLWCGAALGEKKPGSGRKKKYCDEKHKEKFRQSERKRPSADERGGCDEPSRPADPSSTE